MIDCLWPNTKKDRDMRALNIWSDLFVVSGAELRLIGPGGKRLYPSGELASCTNGAFLSAHQPAHSPQQERALSTVRCAAICRSCINALTCCAPIINHTGPVRRIS